MIVDSPVGMPGRAIDGEFIHSVNNGLEKPRKCSFHCIKTCDYTKSPYCIIKALYNAAKGNMKKGYAFAGSNAFLADKISSVKEGSGHGIHDRGFRTVRAAVLSALS